MIIKIISGGQYGADIGGLAAARDNLIPTGGYAPLGYKTIYGPNPKLKMLGLIELGTANYRSRTFKNVKHSDGTIRFAYDFNTPGEICTIKALTFFKKPHFDISLDNLPEIDKVIEWIKAFDIKILNVAGNTGKNRKESNKIFCIVRKYLGQVLSELKKESTCTLK
ncbi:MAG: putative molybdenum carrier protein [Candidatus Woesearchaeota archaeon]